MRSRLFMPPNLETNRRGSALLVVLLLALAVTAMGLMSIRHGQEEIAYSIVSTDSQRALDVADACAAGAIKTLPLMLDYYLTQMSTTGEFPPIVNQQFDANYFGNEPFGAAPRVASCVVTIEEISDDAPAPGYSEGGGCFKRISLRATASLSRTTPGGVESSDILQQQSATVRQVIVRGLFGPVTCN